MRYFPQFEKLLKPDKPGEQVLLITFTSHPAAFIRTRSLRAVGQVNAHEFIGYTRRGNLGLTAGGGIERPGPVAVQVAKTVSHALYYTDSANRQGVALCDDTERHKAALIMTRPMIRTT